MNSSIISSEMSFSPKKINDSFKNMSGKIPPATQFKIKKILKEAVEDFSDLSDTEALQKKIKKTGFIPIVFLVVEDATELEYTFPPHLQYLRLKIKDYTFIIGGKPKSLFNVFDSFFI